jgi:biopolymer transport protein ExbB
MFDSARRFAATLCSGILVIAAVCLWGGTPGLVHAQDEAAPAAEAPAEVAPAEVAPAAAPPAAAAPVPGGEAPAETVPQTSTLMWLIYTSGWIGGVLLLMSIYFVAQVVRLFQDLRSNVVMPQELTEEMDTLLAARDYPGILRVARESQCELGQLVASGLSSLSSGLAEARDSVDRMGEVITVDMEKRISMLAVIGSLGPLVGLLGTLKGMIGSFSVIAREGAQLKASEVAGHISEALLITFEGVALSVPAIFLFAVFKNRVATLSLQAITLADEFLLRVHSTARAGKSAQTPQA